MLDRWFAWNAPSPLAVGARCRGCVLAAQHTSLFMNIVRLIAYLAIGLLVAILLQSLSLAARLSNMPPTGAVVSRTPCRGPAGEGAGGRDPVRPTMGPDFGNGSLNLS